jgi:aspartate-semialdehyde dehydrogenase
MTNKLRVGIVGGTGMVGQRLVCLLENHPWFEVKVIVASKRSAGLNYEEAVKDRWKMEGEIPKAVKEIIVKDGIDIDDISSNVDFIFCAVSLSKEVTKILEENYAKHEVPVISCNSANRLVPDIPMVIPEINSDHLYIIEKQKKRLGTTKGFIVTKPNCSIQSYVPPISALMRFNPKTILACTYQAISGSGKTFDDWPEMTDNVIPYIEGEEEKSENEPLKIWGKVNNEVITNAPQPVITTQCIRVPVSDGHLAAVFVSFESKPAKEDIISLWHKFKVAEPIKNLPSAPKRFLQYFEDKDRPQTKLDRNFENGMGISMGRLREDKLYDYKFICLSHNTLRGAAGGAVLIAETLKAMGYLY